MKRFFKVSSIGLRSLFGSVPSKVSAATTMWCTAPDEGGAREGESRASSRRRAVTIERGVGEHSLYWYYYHEVFIHSWSTGDCRIGGLAERAGSSARMRRGEGLVMTRRAARPHAGTCHVAECDRIPSKNGERGEAFFKHKPSTKSDIELGTE